jgi:DnaK suppressor protein
MTKIELNAFRRALESRQAELGSANTNREALAMQPSPDELDRIRHASERDMAIGNIERDSTRLREVRAALRRIKAGTFGSCVKYEADINLKRLVAIPWASSCIVCQESADRERKTPWNETDTSLVMAA